MTRRHHRRTRIKICGITDVESAQVASDAGADAIGVVFAPGSPRRVDIDQAFRISSAVDPFTACVAVYQNPSLDDASLAQWRGDWLQLHGDEDESLLTQIRRCLIKGFQFDPEQVRRWDACNLVDALLIDGSAGGEGTGFNHEELAEMSEEVSKPVILAGGLTPKNVGEAIRTVRPYAVDVSSGVESAPGRKDADLIRAFCRAVQQVDAELLT